MSNASFLLPSDPGANYLAHKEEIVDAVHRVLDSGWYILGQEVTAFEQEFATYLGVQQAVSTGSGTEAIHLALRACGIGAGDAVITVSLTAVATIAAIELSGATPVFVDIDPVTFTMDVARVEETIQRCTVGRPRAILPVHLYGHPVDMRPLLEIARRYDLVVIEDCAQSHGAGVNGKKTGSWGHMAAFSFYPTKNMGALGDGGALVTDDPDLAEKARLLRQYGWRERYISELPGLNTRLDEVQAAILRVKLLHLDDENARRRSIARLYDTLLASTALTLPQSRGHVDHVYHQYVVCGADRDGLSAFLKANGIGTAILYPLAVHQQPAYQGRLVSEAGVLAHTEGACRNLLCLPMHPQLTDLQVEQIGELIVCWHKQGSNLQKQSWS